MTRYALIRSNAIMSSFTCSSISFNVFDARIYLSQAVVDLGAINDARAKAHTLAATRLTYQSARDFVIHGPETHGVKGLVNLYGIESPGLTSALAIADYVAAMV